MKVGNFREVMNNVDGASKRQLQTQSNTIQVAVRKYKIEVKQDNKEAEVSDKDGVEVKFMNDYIGRADILIDKLILSKEVQIPVLKEKVSSLKDKILQRPDQ